MKIIGITGSIASGKTTVANLMAGKKYPLFNADKIVSNSLQLQPPHIFAKSDSPHCPHLPVSECFGSLHLFQFGDSLRILPYLSRSCLLPEHLANQFWA